MDDASWQQYKDAKEQWVGNHTGGPLVRILAVCGACLTGYATWMLVLRPLRLAGMRALLADFATLVLPLLLACTQFAYHLVPLHLSLAALVLAEYSRRTHPLTNAAKRGRTSLQKFADALNGIDTDIQSEQRSSEPTPKACFTPGSDTATPRGSECTSFDEHSFAYAQDAIHDAIAEESDVDDVVASLSVPQTSPLHSPDTDDTPRANQREFPEYSTPNETRRVLTVFRANLMILTVVCILAVDFAVFPREFAKCETWGMSLMDLGVGAFVFSHGIVSVRVRRPIRERLTRIARRMFPLLVLGAVRVAMVKGTAYPEHVSEYGVHWNFFFTQAALLPVTELVQLLVPQSSLGVLGVLIAVAHQVVLTTTPLEAWAVSTHRTPQSLISLNKEGITSVPGYVAIALLGVDTGAALRAVPPVPLMPLCKRALVWWSLLLVCHGASIETSRRLANLPYVLLTAAFSISFLLGLLCIARWTAARPGAPGMAPRAPRLLALVNRHGLAVFLAVGGGCAATCRY